MQEAEVGLFPAGERRNHRDRAELLARVIAWLRSQTSPAADVEVLGDAAAATRILRQLAIKGLARRLGHGWLPSPALLNAARLERWDAVA